MRPDLIGVKWFRQFLSVVHKLPATWPQGWTYRGQQLPGLRTIFMSHGSHGFSNNILHTATPAGMNIGNCLIDGIMEHYCLAICLLNHEGHAGQIGDEGIITRMLRIFGRPFCDGQDFAAMHLLGRNQAFYTQMLLYSLAIFTHTLLRIAHMQTHIQRIIGPTTGAPVPAIASVNNLVRGKMLKNVGMHSLHQKKRGKGLRPSLFVIQKYYF